MHADLIEPGFYLRQLIIHADGSVEQEAFVYPRGTPTRQTGVLPAYPTFADADSAKNDVMLEHAGLYGPDLPRREIVIIHSSKLLTEEPRRVHQLCG